MTDSGKKYTYFITGGGTGGHIYPAVAVADELVKRDEKIFYVGNPQNLEYDIVSQKGFEFLPVYVHGMPRKAGLTLVKWFIELGMAVLTTNVTSVHAGISSTPKRFRGAESNVTRWRSHLVKLTKNAKPMAAVMA